MSCEDQSLFHRRPKEVVAHWILQSSSLSSRQSYVTVLPRYMKVCTFARWVPLTDNGFLTTEFWSARTSTCNYRISVPCYRCFSRIQPAAVCTTTTSPLPGTPATSPAWQCGPQNPHSHGGWRQPLPRREPLHGLPGFRTEIPWDPGSKPHGLAKQSGDTCGLTIITLYHWTHWVHHEHDDDDWIVLY